ncbi:DegT/DnrJ/EryC1/StrS family aminotransferase [Streptomyces zhihengii]|uniref:DegT/DnrJ/EryC1/StrS family aminotransferase n=1 Tax=Streptomyces zhihengii TaxID=1818004 RepID=A0ABS2V576_9ACTN|nr:DegT/DnrJ/EryC1/StrS family aminotransferase [Streptomyces zhihengii]MBM9624165.1 DegT/DnrJ/EryC1/StrS family aminotransferase [Streptomyces zhihengii]
MRVPFSQVREENRELMDELLPRLTEVLESGVLVGGDEVPRFERAFARLHGTREAVAVNSGTDALRLALRALGVPRGSVGITVANTFVATVGALVSEGVRPLLVDVGADENIDPEAVAAAVTEETGVVVAVHLRGRPAQMDVLRDLCAERGVPLIEDCAQAVGAVFSGRPVGGFGAVGCFSLHPLKNLAACGDAGVVVTDDTKLADRLRLLRNHGLADRDTVALWGENSRLDPLQAAALDVKLSRLAGWTKSRRELAALYDARLAGLPLVLPAHGPDRTHVYHRYVVRTPWRAELRAHLAAAGVETAIHYPVPVHRQPAARTGGVAVADGGLPVTEHQSGEILSLPLHPLLTEEQIDYVTDRITEFHHRRSLRAHRDEVGA